MFEKILAVAVGAFLYIILNWVIVIGPIISGFAAGRLARCKPKDGFFVGVLSAILGFCIIAYAMDFTAFRVNSLWDFLVSWIFLLWNLIGFLFSGVGGALGSLIAEPLGFFPGVRRHGRGSVVKESDPLVYVICPNCGFSNSERNEYCKSCGAKIVG
jgi:hypothetical protein